MIDVFYTPDRLAKSMVTSLPKGFRPLRIVDFAAGVGNLLEAAESLWPHASVYANDVCQRSARRLRRRKPEWIVSCADFLSDRSRSQSVFGSLSGKFDLVLLNPPFSQRGVKPMNWPGIPTVTSGRAALFVYLALSYLTPTGYLIAILPDGCLSSMRDRQGWSALAEIYDIQVISNNPTNAFKGASARTSIVRIKRRRTASKRSNTATNISAPHLSITQVIRGTSQMHSLKQTIAGGVEVIHTSELRDGEVKESQRHIETGKIVRGPALLFPRVGRVTPEKLCFLEESREVALSDCILGVLCGTAMDAKELRNTILKAWPKFADGYRGTGAPYITIERAINILNEIQISESSKKSQNSTEIQYCCTQTL